MTAATLTLRPKPTVFRTLFPAWDASRPQTFFFMEELLKARTESVFPTNAAEYDEDVNVYLAHLLTRLGSGLNPQTTLFGSEPMWFPPAKNLQRKMKAQWYLNHGEHRLLYLGLFERGENRRRRTELQGMSRSETRNRDLVCGQTCYESAAALLDRGHRSNAQKDIVTKIARHFPSYVQVLATLATRHWDLGAHLSSCDLQKLMGPTPPITTTVMGQDHAEKMDGFLDELNAYRTSPSKKGRHRVMETAHSLGIDPDQLNLPRLNPRRG